MNNSSPEPSYRGGPPPVDKSGGHISYEPKPEHPCTPPDADAYPIGTRWTCDTCWRFWEVRPSASTSPHNYWRPGLPYPGDVPERPPFPVIPVLICLVIAIGAGIALILTSG